MKRILACLLVFCGVTLGNVVKREDRDTTPCYTKAYSQYTNYRIFKDYENNLKDVGFNDAICRVEQTGMWIYYENIEYNKKLAGKVYWVHGVDISVDFPKKNCGITSSLKYGGNRHQLDEDSFTLYSGEYFTGDEFYGNIATPDLTVVNGKGSSLILTGLSPWTFYTGSAYSGYPVCIYPSTDTDTGSHGIVLHFGLYPSLKAVGAPDNAFRSARKGCYAMTVVEATQMKAEQRFKHGAWGVFNLKKDS